MACTAVGAKVNKGERSQSFLSWCVERKYVPLDTLYKTTKSPLRYICTCGRERSIPWKRMNHGETGCKPCSSLRGASKRKFTIDQARERFLAKKLSLLATEYKDANTRMPYVCVVCEVRGEMRLGTVNFGHGCKTCAERIKAVAKRVSLAEVRGYFEASGLRLLASVYQNNSTSMKYHCTKCGHLDTTTFKVVRRGGGCSRCAILNMTGPGHPRWITDRGEALLRKKLIEKCHAALKHCLMHIDGPKSCRTAELVGYCPQQLRERLERFPEWPELIQGEWHLDHIFPIIAFIEYGVGDVGVINSLDNLQPLHPKSNLSKAGSYDRAEFEAHLKANGIEFVRPR